jgi:hypothetical protein
MELSRGSRDPLLWRGVKGCQVLTIERQPACQYDEDELEYDEDLRIDQAVSRLRFPLRAVSVLAVVLLVGGLVGASRSDADGITSVNHPTNRYPWCEDPMSDFVGDPKGDGYGWEKGRSCVVKPDAQWERDAAAAAASIDPSSGFPWCRDAKSDFVGDSKGDGYGWEYNRTCIVDPDGIHTPAGPPTTRPSVTQPSVTQPPVTQPPVGPPTTSSAAGVTSTTGSHGGTHTPPSAGVVSSTSTSTSGPATTLTVPGPPTTRATSVATAAPTTSGATTTSHTGQHTTRPPVVTSSTPAVVATTQPSSTTRSTQPGSTTTQPITTQPITTSTQPGSTTQTTHPVTHGGGGISGAVFEPIRNNQSKFSRYENVPSSQLSLDALTQLTGRPDNGSVGDGQFRAACEYSHFSYDDPIVYPGQVGRAHLHMFFGNTRTNVNTTTESLVNSGGATCSGFELNRSAYWTPALLDGKGNVVVPDEIILYYKTKVPSVTQAMPQGLKMIAGNTGTGSFTANQYLEWTCGGSGAAYGSTNRIPDCGGDIINATIMFPNCWDGRNLDSANHTSHLAYAGEANPCPGSHPVRLPQISILLYYPGTSSVQGWHLASDRHNGANATPGSTLHADWWGGWNNEAMNLWTNGCIKAARNCSYGQTGTSRQLAPLNGRQQYEGPNFLPIPAGGMPPT